MKNIVPLVYTALRLRLSMQKHEGVGEALSHFSPTGWCGGIAKKDKKPQLEWGGDAIIGSAEVKQDTIFRVASISKVFGAAAAMRLVHHGKLTLDDPVSDVFGFSTGRPVTLRQLLTHTAALDDAPIYDKAIDAGDYPPLEEVLKGSFFPYAPGSKFHYSNLGAGVAGMLVEAASGMLFDDYVRQEFFLPHGIDASFHPQRIIHKEKMANCYRVPGNKLAYNAQEIATQPYDETPNPAQHYFIPAGKLMISAPDLLKAFTALWENDREMFGLQNQIGSVTSDAMRGLGCAYVPDGVFAKGKTFWGHQGVAYGALCQAWICVEDGTAVVMLTNGAKLRALGPLYTAGQSGIAAILDQYTT